VRGIHKCLCENNFVWGVTNYNLITPQEYVDYVDDFPGQPLPEKFISGIRVRAKVSPYNHSYGDIKAGEIPPYAASEETLSFGGVPASYFGQNGSGAGMTVPIGSRAVYIDGEQAYVNYPLSKSGTSMENVCWWIQCRISDGSGSAWHMDPDYDSASDPNNDFVTDGRQLRARVRGNFGNDYSTAGGNNHLTTARNWYAGHRYFVVSNHSPGDLEWYTSRQDRFLDSENNANLREDSLTGFSGNVWAIVRPTQRAYLRGAEENDEVWCMAKNPSYGDGGWSWATGRWQNTLSVHQLIGSEVENILFTGSDLVALGIDYDEFDLVHYNRIQLPGSDPVDLAIFIDLSDSSYWIWNGTELYEADHAANYITMDKTGRIVYGSKSTITREANEDGNGGWTLNSGSTDAEASCFEIMCNDAWITVRHFPGGTSFASGDIVDPTLTDSDGNVFEYLSYSGNERYNEARILSWSISYDGNIRVPHLQARARSPKGYYSVYPGTEDPGDPYPDVDPWPEVTTARRWIVAREYTNTDCSAWQSEYFPLRDGGPGTHPTLPWVPVASGIRNFWNNDSGGSARAFFYDNNGGGLGPDGGGALDPALWETDFIPSGHSSIDFDVVDEACSCGCNRAVYY
jgi:hypothetical protein